MTGNYLPSANEAAAEQVQLYEDSDGRQGGTAFGVPCVILTTVGARSHGLRKTPLMRVEHEGMYAVIGSRRGKPNHPNWYHNLTANPDVQLQVGPESFAAKAHTAEGAERDRLWELMTGIWPNFNVYQTRTDRRIPVVVLERSA